MTSITELECLDYRELQKLAKSKNIRPSGKGATKKRLVSLLWTSMRESLDASGSSEKESNDPLPLTEVPIESVLADSSPKEELWKQLNLGVDLNESNKENNLRRLTFEIVKENKQQSPPVPSSKISKKPQKPVRRVKIIGTPTNVKREELRTPKPPMKIVRTPAATRGSRGTVTSEAPKTPANKTPRLNLKTPTTTKTVALRLAASAKKTDISKSQSRIPKLNPKKLPNFATIHQNAFEKMDSLWDVEKQRVTRMKLTSSANHPAVMLFTAKSGPVKKAPAKKPAKEPAPVVKASTSKRVSPKKTFIPSPKVNRKEVARQAANRAKPQRLVSAKDEQRTFLKGVRINRRFEMQMKNRGLI